MADRKITDLTALAAGSQATGDLLTIVDVSEVAATDKNKKITVESLLKGIPSDVGIGITSPAAKLAIHTTTTTNSSSQLLRITSANGALFGIETDETISNPTWKIGGIVSGGTAEPLAFYQVGSEVARIDSSGRLLVGTTTEGAANADNLTIADSGHAGITIRSGTSSKGAVFFSDATSGSGEFEGVIEYNHSDNNMLFFTSGSEGMRIDSSGRLLVGATSARENYFTSASGQALQFQIEGTDYKNSCASFTSNSTSAGFGPHLAFGRSRGTAIGSNTLVNDGDTLGAIVFHGNDGSKFVQCARIDANVDGTPGTDDMPGRLIFQTTADAASSPTERMRIDSSGNVGIGTTSPACGLHIDNPSNAAITQILDTDNQAVKLVFRNNTETGNNVQIGADGSALVGLTNATERMRIDSSGRLLVGTSSHSTSAKLVVQARTSDSSSYANFALQRGSTPTSSNPTLGVLNFADNSERQAAYILAAFDAGTWTDGSSHPGRLVFATTANGASSATERMQITSSGEIRTRNGGFFSGTNNGDVPYSNAPIVLQNTSNNTNATMIQFKGYNGSLTGSISTRVNVTTYSTSSDYRLKENVVAIADGITRVKQLAPKRFNFIGYDDTTCDGFLAHEAQAVVPEAVVGTHNEVDGDGNAVMQGIDQSKLVPLLTAALQEAIAEIETLKTKVAALEAG